MRLNPWSKSRTIVANAKDASSSVPSTRLDQQYTLPGLLSRSAYDNGFAPISAISDEILKRNLHLGDVNNPETDITKQFMFWNTFIKPNDRMGFMQFLDLLVAGFLSLSELSFLVWHSNGGEPIPGAPEGGFTLDSICGFTVISEACKGYDSYGYEQWNINLGVGNGTKKFSREDVLTLKYSLLPDDGVSGVSPGSASGQEAAIRDRLNQQQRALFDNGATPSIIVTIHARSHDEFTTIQQAYEKNNRGAAKAGGVVYQSVIDNGMLAGMGEPKIVITPVGTANNQLAIKEIIEFTESTITSNYGVSPIIYGDATTTTFQNQELADRKFMDRVQAILVRLFASFENELSRLINMPLPFTFVWDDVEFDLTQEQEIKARTKTENVRAFVGLVQSGATPEQAATVLELGDDWKKIAIVEPVTTPDIAPAAPTLNMFKPIEPLMLEGCSCEAHNALPKKVSEQEQSAQKKILNILKKLAKELFDKKATNAVSVYDQQIIDELTSVMAQGSTVAGTQLLNDVGDDLVLADFTSLSKSSISKLEKRATKVVTNYKDFVTEKLNSLADDDPAKKVFTEFYNKAGGGSGDSVQSRANLISQQETKNAYQNGELDVGENIDKWLTKNKPQSYIVKTWRTTSDKPCPFCQKMDGTEAGIKDRFVPGGLIDDGDTTLVLDSAYSDGSIPDAHANCQCVFKFSLKSK